MHIAAFVAPTIASISTPVLCVVLTTQSIVSSDRSVADCCICGVIVILQSSRATGWQKGIKSAVFFAAITPAIIAVANTGPLVPTISLGWSDERRSAIYFVNSGGKLTVAYRRKTVCVIYLLKACQHRCIDHQPGHVQHELRQFYGKRQP
jgi:hypothetical protein